MSSSAMYAANRSQQTWSNPHQLRKQRSFGESTTTTVSSRISNQCSDSNRSGRGKSANRSGSVILARLPSERNKFLYLQKQRSVVDQVCAGIRGRSEQRSRKYSFAGIGDKGSWTSQACTNNAASGGGGPKLAWTDSTYDCDRLIESGTFLSSNSKKNATSQHSMSDRTKKSNSSSKTENKINLNINLTHTIKSADNDSINSDVDSSSDGADYVKTTQHHSDTKKPAVDLNRSNLQSACRISSAAQRRAQFQSSKGDQFCTSSVSPTVASPNAVILSASPSLTIQKRPPLVRAMSAPVRSIADTTKNLLANTRRKTRRRRILPRNSSCDKGGETDPVAENSAIVQTGKKIFSRSRSTIASDVITLVSLASSEGSDSEKEESGSADECQTARAPLLRKTGKSVSFQENEQPTFQMAVKEFPHMLRRGSIAPLAARLRANRPPTAPPGSIFRTDFENCTIKMSHLIKNQTKDDLSDGSSRKENNTFNNNSSPSHPESESPVGFDFPNHVRSIKERECWKLFQKMSKKGVSVKYDTILRGMLTPTEFRHLQKQREIDNAKNQETDELNESTASNDAEKNIQNKNDAD